MAFTLTNCLFGEVKLTRNAIKWKFVYNGSGIPFNETGSWSFRNDFDRNNVIFAVDNSSASQTDNQKKKIFSIRWRTRKNSINFTKEKKHYFSLYYSDNESYLYVNNTENCKFKVHDNTPW